MYSVMDGLEQGVQYNSSYNLHNTPVLTTTTSILNLSSEFHPAPSDQQQYEQQEYKTEPATPSCTQDTFNTYPTSFTPSPSSSGCESPSTPVNQYNNYFCNLSDTTNTERVVVPFPAPTPPLSASHISKDIAHRIPDPNDMKSQCNFSAEQIDCICDNLQNRGVIDVLGKHFYIIL